MTDWRNRIVGEGLEDPEQLLANPFNARIHPKFQQDSLESVLDEIGWVQRVIVNRTTSHVIDGHLRVALAITRGEQVPVDYVELTESEEKTILATFDYITSLANYDNDLLTDLLQDVNTDNAALQALLDDMAQQNGIDLLEETPLEDAGPQMDRAGELQEKYGTQLGQVWQLGKHRLAIGDSTDKNTIDALMQGKKADAIITDPPYGMRLDADYSSAKAPERMRISKNIKGGLKWDNVIGDHEDFDASPISNQFSYVKEQFWFGADYYSQTLPDTMHSGSWLVWDKRLDESMDKMFGSSFELIWSMKKHKRDILRHKWAGVFGTEQELEKRRLHPTMKPTSLMVDLIDRYVDEGAMVVDCFLGSGAVLVACEQTARICYGVELDPRYAAVVIQRWETLTGQTARLDTSTHEIQF